MDLLSYKSKGDKKNSDFFWESLDRIYRWRKAKGLDQVLGKMRAILLQVSSGNALSYLQELYMMTPYRLQACYKNKTHSIYVLHNTDASPKYIVLEPHSPDFEDESTCFNKLYPLTDQTPQAHYIGEVYHAGQIDEAKSILMAQNVSFLEHDRSPNDFFSNQNFLFTRLSPYTGNRVGYTHSTMQDIDALELGTPFSLSQDAYSKLNVAGNFATEHGFEKILLGVDHCATRVLSSSRECAILEFTLMSNYYFWGAFNISDMNSSTNVTRYAGEEESSDTDSPAKVFTANNTPYFVNAFEGKPMPTEEFVLNLGPRMHHIAQAVADGEHSGQKNIDYVVSVLKSDAGINFLAKIFGECKEPDLKQIFSKRSRYSLLITEYIQRCFGYDNFFTKANVAALTEAAGADEQIKQRMDQHGHVFD